MAASPAATATAQLGFDETRLTEQHFIDAVASFDDARQELIRLKDLRKTIADLEKQKATARKSLAKKLDLSKPGIYRVGRYRIEVTLPEEKTKTVEKSYEPKIKLIADDDPLT
jgi:hypothetical protein